MELTNDNEKKVLRKTVAALEGRKEGRKEELE
jgi:hypothetical protein